MNYTVDNLKKLNFYEIFEIPITATDDVIRKSFLRLSMIYHPDKNNDPVTKQRNTEIFKIINEAYDTLRDPIKKQSYNVSLNLRQAQNNVNNNANYSNNIPKFKGTNNDELLSNIFNVIFNNPQNNLFANMNLNNTVFNKPPAILKEITLELASVYQNNTIPIEIMRYNYVFGENKELIKQYEKETVYVDVHQGVDNGEIITILNKGDISNTGVQGDIKVTVKIINTQYPQFIRNGLNIIYLKQISLKESLCGFNCVFQHVNGKKYTISTTNITQLNKESIMKDLGIPRGNNIGHLIVKFDIKFPEYLEAQTVEELKKINF
jgi:DnaJ-class molecular chaperone